MTPWHPLVDVVEDEDEDEVVEGEVEEEVEEEVVVKMVKPVQSGCRLDSGGSWRN